MFNVKAGQKVRVVAIEKMWDSEKYEANGSPFYPNKYVVNGEEGVLVDDPEFSDGSLFIRFKDGSQSQTFEPMEDDENLDEVVEIIDCE